MIINSNKSLKSIDGEVLKYVNFIYIGSEIESTDKEINIRIPKSWAALRQVKLYMEITTQHNFKEELLQSRGRICFIIRL